MSNLEHEKSRLNSARAARTQTALLPIFFRTEGRVALVVGGGAVGTRKAGSLVEAGFSVIVISPVLTKELQQMAERSAIQFRAEAWPAGAEMLSSATLVFACTNDAQVNQSVAAAARAARVPVNIADDPECSDFLSPAVVRMPEEELIVAVSTGGRAPSIARKLREELTAFLRAAATRPR